MDQKGKAHANNCHEDCEWEEHALKSCDCNCGQLSLVHNLMGMQGMLLPMLPGITDRAQEAGN